MKNPENDLKQIVMALTYFILTCHFFPIRLLLNECFIDCLIRLLIVCGWQNTDCFNSSVGLRWWGSSRLTWVQIYKRPEKPKTTVPLLDRFFSLVERYFPGTIFGQGGHTPILSSAFAFLGFLVELTIEELLRCSGMEFATINASPHSLNCTIIIWNSFGRNNTLCWLTTCYQTGISHRLLLCICMYFIVLLPAFIKWHIPLVCHLLPGDSVISDAIGFSCGGIFILWLAWATMIHGLSQWHTLNLMFLWWCILVMTAILHAFNVALGRPTKLHGLEILVCPWHPMSDNLLFVRDQLRSLLWTRLELRQVWASLQPLQTYRQFFFLLRDPFVDLGHSAKLMSLPKPQLLPEP